MKIIVVDDEPIIAETLVEILKGEGHDALAFQTGDSVVEKARIMRPDLVLADVVMPRMNGIELAKSLHKVMPHCRIILLSGNAESSELISNAREEGYQFEVLAKPIHPQRLLARINGGSL